MNLKSVPIKLSFAEEVKTFVNAVGSQAQGVTKEEIEKVLQTLGIDTRIRGEVLDIGGFAKISDEISNLHDADL